MSQLIKAVLRLICFEKRYSFGKDDNSVKLKVLITGSGEKIELTDFTVRSFSKHKRTFNEGLAYPAIQKPSVKLEGRIDLHTEADETPDALKLAQWSLVPADDEDAYRKVEVTRYTVDTEESVIMDEEITFERGFILNYEEKFADTEGTKAFSIILADAAEFIA